MKKILSAILLLFSVNAFCADGILRISYIKEIGVKDDFIYFTNPIGPWIPVPKGWLFYNLNPPIKVPSNEGGVFAIASYNIHDGVKPILTISKTGGMGVNGVSAYYIRYVQDTMSYNRCYYVYDNTVSDLGVQLFQSNKPNYPKWDVQINFGDSKYLVQMDANGDCF